MGMDQVLSAIVNGLEAQNSGKKRAAAEALQTVEQLAESPWPLDLVDDFLRACFSAFLLEIVGTLLRLLIRYHCLVYVRIVYTRHDLKASVS